MAAFRLARWPIEFCIIIVVESINNGLVVFHRTGTKNMVQATTAEAAPKFRRKVPDGNTRCGQ